jgi:hypothetical protein
MVQPKPGFLAGIGLEDDGPIILPPRSDDAQVRLERVEPQVAEHLLRELLQRGGLLARQHLSHDFDEAQPVERFDFVDRLSEPQQRGDDGAGRRPIDQVELLAENAADERLNLLKRPERVEALSSAAVEAQHTAQVLSRPVAHSYFPNFVGHSFDMVMAWSVYRLGRSLRDLIAFLSKAMYQMLGVFAEFERAMIQQRVRAA